MPDTGRDYQLEQNRARAATTATTQTVNEAQTPTVSIEEKTLTTSHRSLFGGNLEVAEYLNSVLFASGGPDNDGSMRNAVAYIQYWDRNASYNQSSSGVSPSSGAIGAGQVANDNLSQVAKQVNTAYTLPESTSSSGGGIVEVNPNTSLETIYPPSASSIYDASTTAATTAAATASGSNLTTTTGTSSGAVAGQANDDRKAAVAEVTPTTNDVSSSPQNLTIQTTTITSNGSNSASGGSGSGSDDITISSVKSANPSGTNSNLLPNGSSYPYSTPTPGSLPSQVPYSGITLSSVQGRGRVSPVGIKPSGKWQFLFNPSELEVVAGPEYKVAETWGVSDKRNSGQPLSWSHNKNAQLKFNAVLLNGYVFGKQVEELEQGIFELFMARDGAGQDGPPVLEFVWGQKVFGPCVIKDISIKEKMWDNGLVVNAEMSFTLEQVPEWTINDGYVDVARPGRLPVVYDPIEPPSTGAEGAGAGAGAEKDTPPPADGSGKKQGTPSGQKPSTGPLPFTQCKVVQTDKDAALQVAKSIIDATSVLSGFAFIDSSDKFMNYASPLYVNLYNKYSKNTFYSSAISSSLSAKCKTPTKFLSEYNSYKMGTLVAGGRKRPSDLLINQMAKSLGTEMAACATKIASSIETVFKSRCGQFRENAANSNERI